ncbi:MAG: DUF2065 domain-containing protein [Pseudomonadota bacterium]|nr:DUF2065 domain-containing protein [Pseudomonadota bacterium]MED5408055.1 DUF2065 domain-containing protein [Pseudomonadota bacterium]MEE3288313.1 DUF2065 domain-containing protein [Pseudomonadota bacterium]
MNWQELLAALALVLVFEGLVPFASPGRYRKLVKLLSSVGDGQLRAVGGVCMLAGVLLLYSVH